MNTGKTLFAQLMDFLPWTTFTRIVDRYGGDHRVRTLFCAEQYRSMAFAQLTYRESLVNGGAKLVHPGGAKLVHLTLCGTRCWGVVPVVHRRDPRCFE